MYTPYLTAGEYAALGGSIPAEEQEKYLENASRNIDSLTFNRIVRQGFDKLSVFQQNLIKKVCFELANFEYENADALKSVLSGYAINGVSMKFGEGMNVCSVGGVTIGKDTYALLLQTGLCYRGVG